MENRNRVGCAGDGLEQGMYAEGFRYFGGLFNDWNRLQKDHREFCARWCWVDWNEIKRYASEGMSPWSAKRHSSSSMGLS